MKFPQPNRSFMNTAVICYHNKMLSIKKTLLFTLLGTSSILAQETSTVLPQNPTSIKWSQVKTKHFRLIFPSTIAPTAMKTANTLEAVYQPVSQSLGIAPKPVSILLQNQTVVSNGFITITPRHGEFYTTTPQDNNLLGTNDWLKLLSVHEYRHVVQFEKSFQGKGKILRFLLGNIGSQLLGSFVVPNWFWEGDAVGSETSFTSSGRGKIPAFEMALRTQLLSRGAFSYPKSVDGSYQDYVPNHYVNGYVLTTYLKNKFGRDIWDSVLTEVYKKPSQLYSFSNTIHKVTGLTVEELYKAAYQDVTDKWTVQANQVKETPATYYETENPRYFTNYEYPQVVEDGRVVALKSGLSAIQQLVLLSKVGKEEKLAEIGVLNDAATLSAAGTKVVWSEIGYHPRWAMKTYSVIKILDLKTKKINQVTTQTRLAAPALDAEGARIVAVETDTENNNALVILDAKTGQLQQRINNVTNGFFIHPTWANAKQLVVVRLLNGKKSILEINIATGQTNELTEAVDENIAHPFKQDKYVFFNSGVTGIDNVFVVNTETRQRFQVTNRKFGGFNATLSANGKSLIFNDFTDKGHRIASMPLDTTLWLPFDEKLLKPIRYFGQMLMQEAGENLLNKVDDSVYVVKPYRKTNLVNLYAWGLLLRSRDNNTLNLGISSQNLLGTAAFSGGLTFNTNERTWQQFVSASYQAWYPILDFSYTNGQRNTSAYIDKDTKLDSLRSDTWRQQQWLMGFRLPFNLTHSKYRETLSLSTHLTINQVEGYDLGVRTSASSGINGNVNSMIYGLSYSRLLKRAVRDIAPKWGQSLSLYHRQSFNSVLNGGITSIQGALFFPGLMRHHSFRVRGGYQHQVGLKTVEGAVSPTFYYFASTLALPRGYSYQNVENLWTATAEYSLPLATPDWTWGRLVYVKRIKTTFFADLGQGETYYAKIKKQDLVNYTSLGVELSVEFHPFRYQNPLELGVRVLHQPRTGQTLVQPLVINIGF